MNPASTLASPSPTRLVDYRPPAWLADTVALVFDLHEDHATVTATTSYRRNPGTSGDELVLDGEELELVSLRLDDRELSPDDYSLADGALRLQPPSERCRLTVVTRIAPQDNTTLQGLYRAGGMFCTQMEAEGFRRVTFFQDRPDVLAIYTTTIRADKGRYPVLLSNGNRIDLGELPGGRHFATWHDPHRKPCYLFALVAGDLALIEDTFTTRSGRAVALRLYVDPGNEDKTAHAMHSLKKSMRWDEQAFGREYDLDVFMTVAVSRFNMGAMENKGLNIFNDQAVLARAQTATDEDFARIEGVVGHEYFHNWSGNRVTCRDWFQLSLKEGFTVYRDQEFSSDVGHPAVQRIRDVDDLRTRQYPEDGGPLAHAVRPASYIAIDNFYTATIYEKGAEVIRMLAAVLGPADFRRGCDLYFERHDGQAVRTEDFLAALADASGKDLSAFQRWYDQAGTPRLSASGRYDAATRSYELRLEQLPPTAGSTNAAPFPIPVRVGLVGPDGRDLPLRLHDERRAGAETSRVLLLDGRAASFRFVDVPAPPVPSVLRGFSAPVRLQLDLGDDELSFLAGHDSDLFNRWEAGQRLASRVLIGQANAGQARADQTPAKPLGGGQARARRSGALPECLLETFGALLADESLAPAFLAAALSLPEERVLADQCELVDVEGLHAAREAACASLAATHGGALLATYERLRAEVAAAERGGPWSFEQAGRRALQNTCLGYLAYRPGGQGLELAAAQFRAAATMTDEQAALEILAAADNPHREAALQRFRERWSSDALVMNKWFAAQAKSSRQGVVDDVRRLGQDPLFDRGNPNNVRALYRTFGQNLARFHGRDGRGYALLADVVLELDGKNPILAARLAALLDGWRRHEPVRRAALRGQLERLLASGPSRNLFEVASKALA